MRVTERGGEENKGEQEKGVHRRTNNGKFRTRVKSEYDARTDTNELR